MAEDPGSQEPVEADRERSQHLEELLFQCLEARAAGDSTRLAALLAAEPAQASMLQQLLGIADGLHQGQPLQRLGEYELLHELGGGGMGVVYLARQPRLQRLVAIKVIRPELLGSAKMRERFHREARALARVAHPGICPIYDFGEFEGQPFLVMQYLPGKRVAELPPPHTRVELDERLLLWQRVSEAVHVAHTAGLVHRDLKPHNVVLAADDRPVVLDFGLARILDDESPDAGLTTQNQPLGTPAYMAPERLTGTANAAGPGVDVYALGVCLFQGVTGELPFQAPVVEALWSQILRGEPRTQGLRQRWLPRDLQVVVRTAMEREPARRYASARDLGEDLRRVRAGESILAQRPSLATRVVRWTQRNRVVAALLVGLSIAVVVTSVLMVQLATRGRHDRSLALAGEATRHRQKNPALQAQFALAALAEQDLEPARSELAQSLADWQLQTRLVDRETISSMAVALPNGGMAAVVNEREVVTSRAFAGRTHFAHEDGGPIVSCAVAPDETQLACGGSDGRLCLIDLRSGAETRVTVGVERITLLQYEPSGERLAIATDRFEGAGKRTGGLHLLDRGASAVRTIDSFTGVNLMLLQMIFPSGSGNVLTVVQGQFVVAHRLVDGQQVMQFTNDVEPKDPIVCVQLVANDTALVCGCARGTLFEISLAGRERREVGRHDGRITNLALSPDERTLASIGEDRCAKLWDLRAADRHDAVVLRHPVMITNLAFDPDGRWLITGANDMAIRLWTPRGDNVLSLASGLGATNMLDPEHDAIWLGSEWNGSGSYELTAHGKQLLLGQAAVTAICLSGSAESLWTGGADGRVQHWSGREVVAMPQQSGGVIVSLTTNSDESQLLAIEEQGVAYVRDLTTGTVQTLAARPGFLRAGWMLDEGDTIQLQTNGPALQGNAITTFRRANKQMPFERVPEVRLLPKGLGAGTFDRRRRQLLLPRPNFGDRGGFVVVDLGGQSADREVRGEACSRVACSPVGELYATCMTSHVWLRRGLDDAAPLLLPTDSSGTNDLVFSPDGRHLGAISKSGAVWLFDTDDGHLVWRGTVPAIGWSVAFTPDSRYLLTGDSNGVVRHWLVRSEQQRELATSRLRAWRWDVEEQRILGENGVAMPGAR